MSPSMKSNLEIALFTGGKYYRTATIGEAAIADVLMTIERQIAIGRQPECIANAA
jgi:hypothetical protein